MLVLCWGSWGQNDAVCMLSLQSCSALPGEPDLHTGRFAPWVQASDVSAVGGEDIFDLPPLKGGAGQSMLNAGADDDILFT